MKTFDEEFPSMRGKEFDDDFGEFFYKECIQKFCLDKQKVREAIKKCLYWDNSTEKSILIEKELLKELGL